MLDAADIEGRFGELLLGQVSKRPMNRIRLRVEIDGIISLGILSLEGVGALEVGSD